MSIYSLIQAMTATHLKGKKKVKHGKGTTPIPQTKLP